VLDLALLPVMQTKVAGLRVRPSLANQSFFLFFIADLLNPHPTYLTINSPDLPVFRLQKMS
jgi:hypothetical protein